MSSNTSLLPVVYNPNKFDKEKPFLSIDEKRYTEKGPEPKYERKKTNHSITTILTVALCLLSLFSLSLFMFSNAGSIISGNKILGYIASDFLGIDPSKDDRNIYEILMSGSFGGHSQSPDDKPNNDNGIAPPIDNGSDSNQNTNNTENNGSANTSPDDDKIIDELPSGEYAIIKTDLSSPQTSISNQTEYDVKIEDFINAANINEGYLFSINENMTVDPIVLIVHTHGTEAFSSEESISYSDTTNIPRSDDITKNIVSVGAEMARILNENGIPTLHCKIMHDKDSYKNSYSRSAESIKEYLKKYPSIKYVFDVHRDSVISESKIKYKPLTVINGEPTAQVMFVMGSDYNAPQHTNWKQNLTLAAKLTDQLNKKYDKFTREMSLRASSYNQEYTVGSMLLEIGSCGNTLNEAKRAGILVANELSDMIKNGW